MPVWIILAIAAQFLHAVVSLIDKYIVTSKKALPDPFAYAFYTCILSGAAVVLYAASAIPAPFDGVAFPTLRNVHFPTLEVVGLSMLAAYTFFYALVSMFRVLQQADASDAMPVIGAVTAIGSFLLASLFLDGGFSPNFLFGIVLLSVGTLLVSHFRFSWTGVRSAIYSGTFFALHFVVMKGLFNVTSFDDGFFWSRAGFVVFAVSLLLVPGYGNKLLKQVKATGKHASAFILLNKVIAGLASVLLLKAVELGDVSVVQALGGLQYVFIFIFGVVLGPHTPEAYGENIRSPKVLIHKAIFIAIIALGFFMLFR